MASHKPEFCLIFAREQAPYALGETDFDWNEFQKDAPLAECAELMGNDPLYILYTSGTTGQPKGVIRQNAGNMVALNWTMKNIYIVEPGDVYCHRYMGVVLCVCVCV